MILITLFSSGSYSVPAGIVYDWEEVTSSSTLATHARIKANAAGGDITITLPDPADCVNIYSFIIKKTDSSLNTVTIVAPSGTLDGETEVVLNYQYDALTFSSDGSNFLCF